MLDELPMLDDRGLLEGRYHLDTPVGRGSNGDVWKATDVQSGDVVAVKLLDSGDAPFDVDRFLRGASLAKRLDIPHAARTFDFGVAKGAFPFLVSELLRGETLARRLDREGRLRPEPLVSILEQVVGALVHAHGMGLVHAGLEPATIVLREDHPESGRSLHVLPPNENVQVIEFGIGGTVNPFDAERSAEAIPLPVSGPHRSPAGSLGHKAPEQVEGDKEPGPAADVWALGVLAYTVLTGRRPFVGDSLASLSDAIVSCTCLSAHEVQRDVPTAFDAWFRRVCVRNPDERPSDLGVLMKDLRTVFPTVDD